MRKCSQTVLIWRVLCGWKDRWEVSAKMEKTVFRQSQQESPLLRVDPWCRRRAPMIEGGSPPMVVVCDKKTRTLMWSRTCAQSPGRPYAIIQGLKSMKSDELCQPRANRTCAQVWVGQVQEGRACARDGHAQAWRTHQDTGVSIWANLL